MESRIFKLKKGSIPRIVINVVAVVKLHAVQDVAVQKTILIRVFSEVIKGEKYKV